MSNHPYPDENIGIRQTQPHKIKKNDTTAGFGCELLAITASKSMTAIGKSLCQQ
jgi:hypothetical protein